MSSQPSSRIVQWLVWGVLAAVILLIGGLYFYRDFPQSLHRGKPLPVYSQVQPFQLTNQMGQAVHLDNLLGHVWVADIIFTSCAGPCPRMTQTMSSLQTNLPPSVKLVTLTTDPERDTPSVLRKYADKYGADHSRWEFLTGPKSELKRLAIEGLKLTALEKPEAEQTSSTDFFVHSTVYMLVDKRGRVRGAFESEEPVAMRQQLLDAVKQLETEKASR